MILQQQQAVLPGLDAALEVQDLIGELVSWFHNAGEVGDAAFLVIVEETGHFEVLPSQLRLLGFQGLLEDVQTLGLFYQI